MAYRIERMNSVELEKSKSKNADITNCTAMVKEKISAETILESFLLQVGKFKLEQRYLYVISSF
jgi:hypothetical protein